MAEPAIRVADADDAQPIASVHAAAWRAAFTFLPPHFLEGMTPEVVLPKWQDDLRSAASSIFVATRDEHVVGFLQLRPDRQAGEVMSLYVDPSNWGQGIGSDLLAFGESWLLTRFAVRAFLWTAKESSQSRGFYESRGWSATGNEQTQLLGPSDTALHEVEYRKSLA